MASLNLNGRTRSVTAAPQALLLDVLCDELGLKGSRFGCGAVRLLQFGDVGRGRGMNTVEPLPRVKRRADGRVLLRTGQVQIGQGLLTALAQTVDTEHKRDGGFNSGSPSMQDAGPALCAACATCP